jgi:hypothetical protein
MAPTRTHAHLPAAPDPGSAALDPTEADAWGRPVIEKEKAKRQPSQRGGEGSRPNPRNEASPARGRKNAGLRRTLSRAGLHAQPTHRSSRPAEPQAELTPRAKPSLLGLKPAHHLFWTKDQADAISFFFSRSDPRAPPVSLGVRLTSGTR